MSWLKNKNHIALSIALLFHVSGATGILFSAQKDWFVQHTPLNLTVMSFLGYTIFGVPLLIGLQWFVLMYCCGVAIHHMQVWMENKFGEMELKLSATIKTVSFIIDGALLAVFFDYIMEPVAVKLGFWQWNNQQIPVYNYTCWLIVSSILLYVFSRLNFNKENHFAVHLFIIQVLFFLALSIYL